MKLSQFLRDIGPCVMYYPALAPVLGGMLPAILFCQLFYWISNDGEEWVEKDPEDIRRHTGLSKTELATARAKLTDLGIITASKRESPPRYSYTINLDKLDEIWETRDDIITARSEANKLRTRNATDARARKRQAERETDYDQKNVGRTFEKNVRRTFETTSDVLLNERATCNQKNVGRGNILHGKNKEKEKKKHDARNARHTSSDSSIKLLKDTFYLIFQEAFQSHYSQPYNAQKKDFVQLVHLIKTFDCKLPDDLFRQAVANYFASEITHHTLADLSVRFATFSKYTIDKYKAAMKGGHDASNNTSGQSSLFGAEVL